MQFAAAGLHFLLLASLTFEETADVTALVLLWLTSSVCVWFALGQACFGWRSGAVWAPGVLINMSAWYYCVKGVFLARGELADHLEQFGVLEAQAGLRLCLAYLLGGVVAFNWAYGRTVAGHVRRLPAPGLARGAGWAIFRPGLYMWLFIGGLSVVGFAGAARLLWVAGSPLALLRDPHMRSYLTDARHGVGDPLAFVYFNAIYMLPLASVIWVSQSAWKRRLSIWWWLHAALSLAVLVGTSPRTAVLGYAVSVIVAFHLCLRPPSLVWLLCLGLAGWGYAYGVRVWRQLGEITSGSGPASATDALTSEASVSGALGFFMGRDLTDINTMVFIERTYGRQVPFQYGVTLVRLFTDYVPRSVWAEKPVDLSMELQQLWNPRSLSGTPPGFFGEMYMNFGGLGVVVGGLLLGPVMGWVFIGLTSRRVGLAGRCLYAAIVPRVLILVSLSVANAIFPMLMAAVPVGLAVAVLRLPRVSTYSLPRRRAVCWRAGGEETSDVG